MQGQGRLGRPRQELRRRRRVRHRLVPLWLRGPPAGPGREVRVGEPGLALGGGGARLGGPGGGLWGVLRAGGIRRGALRVRQAAVMRGRRRGRRGAIRRRAPRVRPPTGSRPGPTWRGMLRTRQTGLRVISICSMEGLVWWDAAAFWVAEGLDDLDCVNYLQEGGLSTDCLTNCSAYSACCAACDRR